MNNLLENRALNCSLADSTFLHWYELTNALSHTHIDAVFNRFQQQLVREIRKNGCNEISTALVIRCFKDVTQKVARTHTLIRFESAVQNDDEAA